MRWKTIQIALLIGIAALTTETFAAVTADVTQLTAASKISMLLDRWQVVAANKGGDTALWRDMMGIQLKQVAPATLDRLLALSTGSNPAAIGEFYQTFIYTLGTDIALRLQAQKTSDKAVAQTAAVQGSDKASSSSVAAGKAGPQSIGSSTIDQTFTPITPCRVVDTRNVGGAIGPFATRNFFFYTTDPSTNWFTIQGGVNGAAGTVCPGTVITGFVPSSAVATVTVTLQGGNGNLIVWQGTAPVASASTISYAASGDTSTLATIPGGGRSGNGPGGPVQDFGVFVNAFTSTNVVVDIVGYYSSPAATALDCVLSTATTASLDTTTRDYNTANTCTSGYFAVSAACEGQGDYNFLQLAGSGVLTSTQTHCFGTYTGSLTVLQRSLSWCCRVPGH
jgi:hypothetical protein